MILRDALKYAVLYLGYDDVIDISNKDVTEKTNKDVRTLVRCANLTYTELICEYLPIYKKEKIRFTNGYFPFSELEDSIANIYSLKKGVENVKYSADATGIYSDDTEAELVYGVMPTQVGLDGVLDIDGRISPKVFSLGVCAEFCMINNLFEESVAFEKRYKDSLNEMLRKKTEIRIKPRRWL